jgi:hypothetical protein
MPPKKHTQRPSVKHTPADAPVVSSEHLHGLLIVIDRKTGKMHKLGEVYAGHHDFAR